MLDPRTERRNLIVLWLGTYLTAASFTLVMPFLPDLLRELGVRQRLETWTGVAVSASFLSSALLAPVWGALADRYGRKPMILRSGVAITLIFLALSRARSPLEVVALRLLNGSLSGFIPASFALLATTLPSERVGRGLAVLQTGPAAGTITGPLLGGTLVHLLGIREALVVAAGVIGTATVMVAVGVREPRRPPSPAPPNPLRDVRAAWRNRRLRRLYGAVLLVQAGNTVVDPLIAIYVRQFAGVRAAPLLTGLLVSLTGLAVVLCAPVWGRLGDRIGPTRLLRRSLLAVAGGQLLQLAAPDLRLLALARFATGVFQAAATPMLHTLLARTADERFRGRAFGLLQSVQMTGNLAGPLVGGAWSEAFGIRYAFLLSSALFLAAAGVAVGVPAAAPPAPGSGPAPDRRPAPDGRVGRDGVARPAGARPARAWGEPPTTAAPAPPRGLDAPDRDGQHGDGAGPSHAG